MPKRIKSSIFVKLTVVLVVAGAFISFAFGMGMSIAMRPKFEPGFRRDMNRYVRYLVGDMGAAPKFEKGAQLAEDLGVGIRIQGVNWEWVSGEDVPKFSDVPPRLARAGDGRQPLNENGRPLRGAGPPHPFVFLFRPPPPPFEVVDYQFPDGPGKVLIAGRRPVLEPDYAMMVYPVILLLLTLVFSYWATRRILSPLKPLLQGVGAMGSGNLEVQVPVQTADELGSLASAFNSMVVRVREMLHSKQQLLLDVSHELRSPLTRAKVGLELLDQTKVTKNISADLDELDHMISGLLESARLGSGHETLSLAPHNVADIVRETVGRYQKQGRRVELGTPLQEALAVVDAERLTTVLQNLLDNAIKYSAEREPVSVSLESSADRFVIKVKDNGIGIAAEEIGKVFEPFYRTDKSRNRSTGGFGLGLSLCQKIVQAHKGTIQISSELGRGTEVTVTIPTPLSTTA